MSSFNGSVRIRPSSVDKIDEIMEIYERAKVYMRKEGNMTQWTGGYPSKEIILKDIEAGQHFSGYDPETGELLMVFTFIIGEDPTYGYIENGEWLNSEPYGTVHRIASSGKRKGMLRECIEFCGDLVDNIRIDTHADNQTMQRGVLKLGFSRCGIIYLADGAPRVAFQKCLTKGER